jgi:hypothetical protein
MHSHTHTRTLWAGDSGCSVKACLPFALQAKAEELSRFLSQRVIDVAAQAQRELRDAAAKLETANQKLATSEGCAFSSPRQYGRAVWKDHWKP